MRANVALNIAGSIAPFAIALVTIPVLIRGLGAERFGVLGIAWAVLGYFGVLDLGVGQAVTRAVAEQLGAGSAQGAQTTTVTGNTLIVAFGLAAMLILYLSSDLLARWLLTTSPGLEREAASAFRLMALGLPFVFSAGGLRGTLEAHQRFGLVNAIRIPGSALNYAAPLFVLPFSHALPAVVAALICARVAVWIAFLVAVLRVSGARYAPSDWSAAELRSLLRLGGWVSVSNVLGPLMTYLDRFFIGAATSLSAVTYYVASYEVVTRVLLLPGAVAGVLVPSFAGEAVRGAPGVARLFERGQALILALTFPILFVVVFFADRILRAWLGNLVSGESIVVMQVLAVGVLFNGIAMVQSALVLGVGRPDISARLHLVELPLYIAALWFGVTRYGIAGAAAAWSARMIVDYFVLTIPVVRLYPATAGAVRRFSLLLLLAAAVLAGAVAAQAAQARR